MKKFFAIVLTMLMMLSVCAFAEEDVYTSVLGAWELCGGMMDDVEWEQADLDNVLAQYGGMLVFAFYEDGTAEMIQGAAVVPGTFTCETESEYVMVATFDINGTELVYYCQFLALEDQVVMLLTNDAENFMYFSPVVIEEAA